MLSTQSLRDQMDRYAGGAISAEALEEWLAAESWDMRRWAPVGLQRLVEAIQAAFIDYSDSKKSAEELRQYLLQRRTQLLRAGEVTKQIEASRNVRLDLVDDQARQNPTEAVSQALMVSPEAVSA
jgi:hypothetical protein